MLRARICLELSLSLEVGLRVEMADGTVTLSAPAGQVWVLQPLTHDVQQHVTRHTGVHVTTELYDTCDSHH